MENTTMSTEEKARTYIKEWKKKNYEKNGEQVRAKNRMYYYKYKFNLDNDDIKKYDIHLPLVAKVWDNLEKLKLAKPELINMCLAKYISTNI